MTLQIFLISLVVFAVAVALMAVGVIFSNRRLRGSCGGLANMKDSKGRTICEACTDPTPDCAGPDKKQTRGRSNAESNSPASTSHESPA